MNSKSLPLLLALVFSSLARVCADGFIVVNEHTEVPRGHYVFAPLEVSRHHVDVKIDGQIATTTVDEEFYNPNDQRLEGTYLFPVPKEAHIDKFSMEVNGQMTDAELMAADKARQIYEGIVRQMRDPALLEYSGRDVFKARIFPIEPHSKKEVKIVYSELLKSDSGALNYTYPLGTEKFSSQPIKDLSVTVDVSADQPLASIYSPSHNVEVKRDGQKHAIVGYEAKNERPDTDFQLVITEEKGDMGLHLLSYKGEDYEGYFMLLAAPSAPEKDKEAKPAPKDVVFVLDTSGSMSGEKIKQAKKALSFCVDNLNDDDRFEILRFSTDVDTLFNKLVPANDENRKHAEKFVKGLEANGGTAIADALKTALNIRPEKEERPFVIIFLTDGQPTVGPRSDEEILAITRKAGGNTRIFSFGLGNDVNTQLLDQLAETTRAFSQYVKPEEDIEVKLSSFFARIKEPAITDLHLEFTGADVKVSKLYPADLPDIFKGDQLVLAGRYDGSGEVTAKLTGKIAGADQEFTYKVKFDEKNTQNEFIPRLWATRRIGYLLDEIRINGENKELRDEATGLARQFGIVTPYTAYLIIEDERSRSVPEQQRSLSDLDKDSSAVEGAGQAYSAFKANKTGENGVANAQSQNAMKFAPAAPSALATANTDAAASFGAIGAIGGNGDGGGSGYAATGKKIAANANATKFVNGRAFFQNGSQWVDGKVQGLTKHETVKFNSDAYYDLLAKHPEAAQWLALGTNIQVAIGDIIYEISE